jgi:hypothetical protein
MIRMSKGKGAETLHAVVIVAFERTNGRVVGGFVHGSYDGPDEAGVTRSRDRLMEELKAGLVGDTDLDVVEIPLHELEQGWIERVDPTKRKLVKSSPHAGRIARP